MTGERRRPAPRWGAAAAVTLAVALSAAVAPHGSAAADPLDDAKARVAAAQDAADAATARYHDAQTRHAEVVLAIEGLEAAIRSGRDEARVLRTRVQQLAVTAYTTAGASVPLAGLGDDEPLTAARRQKLLDQAAGADNAVVEELATLDGGLSRQRDDLQRQRADAEQALAAMDAEATDLQRELAAAQDAQADVEEQIRQLDAARQEAERQHQEAQERARQQEAASQQSQAADESSDTDVPVAAGNMICPVLGAVSFVDTWGAPRPQGRHEGVDLMAARGTPNVGVVSGEVRMRSPGGRPGLGVHLEGDDGNLYYYFHLDSYAGGSRRVAQGEVIGYTGDTGDASGGPTHTHFEVHPGGGAPVNPYPYVASVC
ncbi:MAG: murein hydrolase activator EnvC family protein [Acidimicrobiia bacterium]